MPHLRIETNLQTEKIPADAAATLCSVLSMTLGKPLTYCCVTIIPGLQQSWGGTSEPAGQATLMSIGQLGVKENIAHSKAIFEAIANILGIDGKRLYIHFQDAPASDVGYDGNTFYGLNSGK